MDKKILGNTLVVIGVVFAVLETSYFLGAYGWHLTPGSTSELVCDIVAFAAVLLGLILRRAR